MTEVAIYTPKFGDPYGYIGIVRWQELNKHVLALCPERWKDLHDKQKWVLLRILANRKDYTPDWIDPEIWRSLAPKLKISDFDTDTDILEDGRLYGEGRSKYSKPRLGTIDERGLEQEWEESVMGKAPQTMYDAPMTYRKTIGTNKGRVDGYE